MLQDAQKIISASIAAVLPDEAVQRIVAKYALSIPAHIQPLLDIKTPKQLSGIESIVTGSAAALCDAAARSAKALGYIPLVLTTTLSCEDREAGTVLTAIAREIRRSGRPLPPPCAVIMGGETVVHLRGRGKGGRNQELAPAGAQGISMLENICLFSLGSDGTDGPTNAAGGVVTGGFEAACKANGLSIDAALADNDAYPLLKQMDALLMIGPTGTNVNDVAVLLCR